MASAEAAATHQVLHALRQLQQAKGVGQMAAALADDLGQVLLGIAVAVHESAIALPLLDRVQVLALNVLDDGDLNRFLVGQRADDDRDLVQVGALGGTPTCTRSRSSSARCPTRKRLRSPSSRTFSART